jgi:hypothetical protein
MMPSVAVIVLNWNNPSKTLACLDSLTKITYPDVRLIVVDNGSTNDSVTLIKQHYPDLILLETGVNLGYAGGNNVGIRYALEQSIDFICILNNDVVVAPDFLEPLVNACIQPSGWAIATPMICEISRPEVIWALGGEFDWVVKSAIRLHAGESRLAWGSKNLFAVNFAIGTAMVASRQIWEKVGLIDEAYFLYFEETDWSFRARKTGVEIFAVPAACIWHDIEAAQGRNSPVTTYYMTRNLLLFLSKHLPSKQRLTAILHMATLAHWQALGDLRRGQFRRALLRIQGVYDYFRARFGPL